MFAPLYNTVHLSSLEIIDLLPRLQVKMIEVSDHFSRNAEACRVVIVRILLLTVTNITAKVGTDQL